VDRVVLDLPLCRDPQPWLLRAVRAVRDSELHREAWRALDPGYVGAQSLLLHPWVVGVCRGLVVDGWPSTAVEQDHVEDPRKRRGGRWDGRKHGRRKVGPMKLKAHWTRRLEIHTSFFVSKGVALYGL